MAKKDRPFTSEHVRKMKAVKPTAPPPEAPAHLHTVFVDVERRRTPSATVALTPVGTARGAATWRVDVEVTGPTSGSFVLAPRSERRVLTTAVRKRTREMGELLPFRPNWMGQHSIPIRRPKDPRRRLLHRGREIEPLFVFPPDRRYVYNDPTYPWRCVTRIMSGGVPAGSGVLIGPRHVLTASHVMNWSNPSALVTAHQFDNTNSGSSFATSVWHYEKISDVNSENVEQDYIVLVLASPLGQQLGYLGAKEYDDDWDDEPYWRSIGYAQDMGGTDRPVYQDECILEEEDGGDMMVMVTTTGDFVPGQSGSPVFGWWTKGPYAVGVVSGQAQSKNFIAGGEAMVDLVKIARLLDP